VQAATIPNSQAFFHLSGACGTGNDTPPGLTVAEGQT